MWPEHVGEELSDLSVDFSRFHRALEAFAADLGLKLSELEIDHVAVRCHQNTTAERWKRGLGRIADCLSENEINGRPICLFRLHQPLTLAGQSVAVVELPWPGQTLYRHEGWEHIEVVLRGDPQTLNQRAMALLSDSGLLQPRIAIKCSSPRGEKERLPNPTLAVTNGEITIKFHPWSITEIVASEAD
ncbi:VOC family protein [Pantoea sp. 1.19]|uniref:VOC family protein n=1 Tax=Pantoea sp. 1.19 TaxID=1925589 RepID=UPI000948C937|nr:VOC family protein [Pantoea sp. 1.19]